MNNLWLVNKIIEQIKYDYIVPNYSVEVVIDTILTIFIEEIINTKYKSNSCNSEKITFICKEFPLKKEENRGSNKIDYLLADSNTLYFVELKTSSDSFSDGQLNKYLDVKNKILKGDINANMLLENLNIIGDINGEIDFINKTRHEKKYYTFYKTIENTLEQIKYFKNVNNIEIIYVLPSLIVEYQQLQDCISDNTIKCITLKELSELSLNTDYTDKNTIETWENIKGLFGFIDELDEYLGVD